MERECNAYRGPSFRHIFEREFSSHAKWCFAIFIISTFFAIAVGTNSMGEQCDWTGSGLEMEENKGVIPVYLRCQQGRVSWVYPRGGLRVLFRSSKSGREFRGCIKANPTFSGARIYLETKSEAGGLKEIFDPKDGKPAKLARCFHSVGGQAALYVEAATVRGGVFPKFLAEFSYDLQPLPQNSLRDIYEDCRPCNKEELMQAYCTSDLVATGSIKSVQNEENLDVSEVKVRVAKFLRRPFGRDDTESTSSNQVSLRKRVGGAESVSINVPKNCYTKPTEGTFVFMARKKLGDFSLVCAPRHQHWKQLVARENQMGTSHCILYH